MRGKSNGTLYCNLSCPFSAGGSARLGTAAGHGTAGCDLAGSALARLFSVLWTSNGPGRLFAATPTKAAVTTRTMRRQE